MRDNLKFKIENLKLEWGGVLILGMGILAVFFLLRLINLTIFPIFADEAIYIRWSQVMKAEPTLRFLPLSDGKQPLFMWLVIPFLKFISDPLVAGRMVSVLAGFGSLVGIFLLTLQLIKSKKIALLASFLYAIIPFMVFFDRMALVDSLLTMFGVWILYFGVLLTRYQRLDLAMITGIILGGALLTKSPALFFVLLLPSTIILLTKKKNLPVQLIKLVGLWLVVYAFAYALYNILRLGPNFDMIALRNKDYVFTFKEILSHPLDPFKPHVFQVWEWFWFFAGLPIILAFLGGITAGFKKFKKQTLLLVLWFLVPIFVQMAFAKVFTARYILFCLPSFLIISTLGIFETYNLIKKRLYNTLAFFLVLFVFFSFSLRTDWYLLTDPQKAPLPKDERAGYLEEWTSGYGIFEVRDYLKNLSKNKQIVVGTEGYFGTLPDGLQIYFDKDKNVTVVGVGLELDKVPKPLLESASLGTPTFLVVNKSRMWAQGDPNIKLIFEITKAKGKRGQDSLQFFQVK